MFGGVAPSHLVTPFHAVLVWACDTATSKRVSMAAARNSAQAFTAPVMPSFAGRAIEPRKSALAKLIRGVLDGVAFNQHFTCDGATSFQQRRLAR
jgi:hypothetical protein